MENHRPPPEETKRVTSSGADQFVLACSAWRDAHDDTFEQLVTYEAEIRELRKQLAWAESHSVTRTARYIRSRLFIMAQTIAAVLALLFWFQLNPTGRLLRVQLVKVSQEVDNPKIRRIDGRAWLVRDIPQPEIDAHVHELNNTDPPFLGP